MIFPIILGIILAFFIGRWAITTVPDEMEEGAQYFLLIRDAAMLSAILLAGGVAQVALLVAAVIAFCTVKHYERAYPFIALALTLINPTATTGALLVLAAFIQGSLAGYPEPSAQKN